MAAVVDLDALREGHAEFVLNRGLKLLPLGIRPLRVDVQPQLVRDAVAVVAAIGADLLQKPFVHMREQGDVLGFGRHGGAETPGRAALIGAVSGFDTYWWFRGGWTAAGVPNVEIICSCRKTVVVVAWLYR